MLDTPLHITPAKISDIDSLLQFTQEFYLYEGIPFSASASRAALLEMLHTPAYGALCLLHVGPELAGYFALTYGFILEFGGRHAVLDELYLRPAFRGQGLGQAALHHAESLARQQGCRALRLEVDISHEAARRLYTRVGYSTHQRYTMTKVLSEAPQPLHTRQRD